MSHGPQACDAARLADSRTTLLQVFVLLPPAVALRVKVIGACAFIEHGLGRHSDAHDRLRSALAELPDRSSLMLSR
jgi:hypothetical protein